MYIHLYVYMTICVYRLSCRLFFMVWPFSVSPFYFRLLPSLLFLIASLSFLADSVTLWLTFYHGIFLAILGVALLVSTWTSYTSLSFFIIGILVCTSSLIQVSWLFVGSGIFFFSSLRMFSLYLKGWMPFVFWSASFHVPSTFNHPSPSFHFLISRHSFSFAKLAQAVFRKGRHPGLPRDFFQVFGVQLLLIQKLQGQRWKK